MNAPARRIAATPHVYRGPGTGPALLAEALRRFEANPNTSLPDAEALLRVAQMMGFEVGLASDTAALERDAALLERQLGARREWLARLAGRQP